MLQYHADLLRVCLLALLVCVTACLHVCGCAWVCWPAADISVFLSHAILFVYGGRVSH